MKNLYLTLVLTLLSVGIFAQGGSITGTVTDSETGEALIGANVVIKGTANGDVTDPNGKFEIKGLANGTYTIVASYVGFQAVDQSVSVSGSAVTIDFQLEEGTVFGEEVVISGSRQPEKITETPATIEIISSKDLENWGSFNTGELLSRLKGVDYIRSGVVGTGINVRGFNSNFNAKNTQVTDGRFSSLVATGLPFGPLSPQIKEDIDRVEVILGPNSALYGPNAHNGLVNIITKDPRASEGTTVALGAGNQNVFTSRLRHAQILNDKFAFKLNFEYTRGEEFQFADSVYIDRTDNSGNGGPDGIKEGYEEYDLDNEFEFIKGGLGLYYTLNDDSDLIFSYDASNSTYLSPTNVGRNEIIDWKIQTFHLRYVSPRIFAQAYLSLSDTRDTHSLDDRTKAYWASRDGGASEAEAADASLQSGARFIDDSKRWNGEVQYNNNWGAFNFVTGVQFQRDMANSHGTYLLDENEDDFITVDQIGWYGQGQYAFGSGFKGTFALRADNHDVYGFNFVPKVGLTKTVESGTFRITYGQGVAAPTILNMYGDLFGGLILGNAEGFTLTDGSKVEKQTIEKLQTYEIGYKGNIGSKKLYADVNAYYNISENFLSPVTVVGVTTHRGDTPIEDVQSAYGVYGGLVATYINFGEFNTYGFDIGLNYLVNQNITLDFNYSYFDYPIDEDNLENDFNNDGTVNKLDLLVNAPKNKASFGFNYNKDKIFGNVFVRWVEEYDYFSSFQIAAATQDLTYRGTPIVENARGTDSYNYGPLAGFVNVDLGFGYRITDTFTSSIAVTNLFDSEYREFTASPFIGRLYSIELKLDLPGK
ncbi:iron complex outermembrane recepter protein [Ekhidna lutea]|uniref:Iron complex outermembrane recepter protein n=1 Tax=Ekhidna lutea TaxID=447679 RepID=A0A239FCD5_EKHLU|nr:TonB-dependent receptor [Ekhidna lutea]SNS54391.1 iron complex outermembrane recepter protein [Ekhidna lutea]